MHNQFNQQNEEGESIKFAFAHTPFMLDRDNKLVQEIGLYLLPYSTGFEIECSLQDNCDISVFRDIPNIMDYPTDAVSCEQRFRIPNGVDGLICLFNIAEKMRRWGHLNPDSGIHYHIDFTDVWDSIDTINALVDDETKNYILSELETWNYAGTYNSKVVHVATGGGYWVRFQSGFKTMEVRIGEMTFDYSLLFKRIVHCNSIARNIKTKAFSNHLLKYGKDAKDIINNRIIQL